MVMASHLITIVESERGHEAGAVAAMAWMAWDTAITLDDEVRYLWSDGHLSWVKGMYAFIRYFPLLHDGIVIAFYDRFEYSNVGCRAYIAYKWFGLEALTLAVEFILVMRVLALFEQQRLLKRIIQAAFIVEATCMIAVLVLVIRTQRLTNQCHTSSSPDIFVAYWIVTLVFELFLFVLTLVKCAQNCCTLLRMSETSQKRSLYYIFLRDGTWAFALISGATLLNTLLYQYNTTPACGDGYFWELSVLSFAGSHVILNIRRLKAPESPSHTDSYEPWERSLTYAHAELLPTNTVGSV
ncbi:hypothetical protein PHLGIDRAFT_117184 [Phlebiopsis gigantea 11061_1 CR5-6]|uniref:DUF6533 domain-containing protein n=1 Tax=Phlebiopsis gigantea (strain 11061_1 CR5-6) TaxID=745531 RepID=A0A0C3SC66_PHLG1|nr:hypothetical protein PHLGIDRAFT_117184 [Phlebiopsis gigantea 11061_1 CR5-6]